MTDPPEVHVTGGSPTPEQERAAREAIVRIWRDDLAAAAREHGLSGWTAAARLEATRRGADALRSRAPGTWRLAGRLSAPVSNLQPGRGDAR